MTAGVAEVPAPVAPLDDLDEHGELARCADPYDPRCTGTNFQLDAYLAQFDPKLMASSEGRRTLTRLSPMLFALIYMRKHLRNTEGEISFADAHFLWVRLARRWIGPSRGPKQDRRALVAPRSCGKSSWFFLILPLWAGAHRHVRFAAAFADSGTQAELHLATFKREMEENVLLRTDFPDFCTPARRHTGRTVADNQNMLYTKTEFAFAAKGIDSTSLGMKINEVRPDLIIADDIEPPESNYSPFQRDKRLATLQNAIMLLNESARFVAVGTVTMPGSIIHELVRHSKGEEVEDWITDEQIKTYHTRAIVTRPDGTERSVWPKKWNIDYLQSIRHTRSYMLNYDNDPKGRSGDYWQPEDIKYGRPPNITKWFLFVDPPLTQKTRSDECGLALVGYAPGVATRENRLDIAAIRANGGPERLREALLEHEVEEGKVTRLARIHVEEVWGVRLTGKPLRAHIMTILLKYPQIKAVVLENNAGGSLWVDVFDNLPVKFVTFGSYESKEVRFARALDYFQTNRVTVSKVMPAFENQALAWPRVPHDDVLDAVCSGVLRLLTPKHAQKDGTVVPR